MAVLLLLFVIVEGWIDPSGCGIRFVNRNFWDTFLYTSEWPCSQDDSMDFDGFWWAEGNCKMLIGDVK